MSILLTVVGKLLIWVLTLVNELVISKMDLRLNER